MSIFFRNAHNIENYNNDLTHNHDHQIGHLADEVAHNLRFGAFACHSAKRFDSAARELDFDAHHLSKVDFNREVADIQNRMPNRDLHIQKNKSGNVTHIEFNGKHIY